MMAKTSTAHQICACLGIKSEVSGNLRDQVVLIRSVLVRFSDNTQLQYLLSQAPSTVGKNPDIFAEPTCLFIFERKIVCF